MGSLRWQAQFVLWGGLALLLLSNFMGGQLSAIGRLVWNG